MRRNVVACKADTADKPVHSPAHLAAHTNSSQAALAGHTAQARSGDTRPAMLGHKQTVWHSQIARRGLRRR
jgi:hypothetical protein